MALGAVLGVLGGLLGAGGSVGGGILSRPKIDKNAYFGLNPLQGVVANLFSNPVVSGRGGLMAPSETGLINNYISQARASGFSPEQVNKFIQGGFRWTEDDIQANPDAFERFSQVLGNPYAKDDTTGAYLRDPSGNLVYGGPILPGGFGFQYANPLDPDFIKSSVQDLFTPTPLNSLQQQAFDMSGRVGDNFGTTNALFRDTLLPNAQELVNTGFRTNMDPIRANEEFNFFNRTAPGIASAYGAATGGFSTDFGANLLRELGGLHYGLGALQPQLDEAAAARRASGLSQAGLLGTAYAGLPFTQAAQSLDLGQSLRNLTTSLRPGASFLDAMNQLLSAGNNPLQPLINNITKPGNTGLSEFANAFGSAAGSGLGDSFASLFKRSQDPNAGKTAVNTPSASYPQSDYQQAANNAFGQYSSLF